MGIHAMNYEQIAQEIIAGRHDPSQDLLFSILMGASDAYYNEGDSFLTDAEFDALMLMLETMNPNHPLLAEVGAEVRGGKVKLPITMGSLDQVYENDTEKWVRDNNWDGEVFVLTDKQDGISGLLVYGPKLKIAYSRGNGVQGADITRHIKKFKGVPQSTSKPCILRVEIIVNVDDFKALMEVERQAGRRVYKNPRNYVAGRMNASESPQSFYDIAKVIVTSVEDDTLSKVEQIEFLKQNGFDVTHSIGIVGFELNDNFLTRYLNERRSVSKTEIDGIVIDINDASIRNSLSRKGSSLNPMYARKYKVGDESNVAITEVVKVHYEPSKTGYLKPRVQVKPVDLVGTTIQFATGFNAKFIRDNNIGPGAEIQITRSGDVIPFIQKVVTPAIAQLPTEEEFGAMTWNETEVDLVLENPEDNDDVQLNKLIETFRALDVPGLREGSINSLYEAGYKTAATIIKQPLETFVTVIGEANGTKIYDGIKAKLNPVELGILAGASQMFGRGIGRRKMTKLVDALGSLDNLSTLKIAGVEGFDIKTAEKVMKNLDAFNSFINEIDGFYTLKEKDSPMSDELGDVVVVFTGIRDKELEAVITSKGGTIGSSFNSKTTHVVAKDPNSTSGKAKKAADAGIKPMSLDEAWKLWN